MSATALDVELCMDFSPMEGKCLSSELHTAFAAVPQQLLSALLLVLIPSVHVK